MSTEINIGATDQRKSISWGAVFAGGMMAISVEIVLALLGMGLGLISLQPNTGGEVRALGVGAVAWWFISGVIALFSGGWVAGSCLNTSMSGKGLLHGLLAWGFVNVLSAFLLTTTAVGVLIGGSFTTLQNYLSKNTNINSSAERGGDRKEVADRAPVEINLSAEEKRKAEEASKAAGSAAIVVFFALIFGCVAASLGGIKGLEWRHRLLIS